MATLLLVGGGRRRRRAVERARARGLAVVDPEASEAVAGVLGLDDGRAAAAATAARLGLPGIGREALHLTGNKIAMRRRFAEVGVPQPEFAAVRSIHEGHAGLAAVGVPAVLKPADGRRQRGVFRLESADDLDAHLHTALAESAEGEAIVESFHAGLELNVVAVARGADVTTLTVSDRRRAGGRAFAVATAHVFPTGLFGDVLEEVDRIVGHAGRALALRDTLFLAQVLVSDDGLHLLEVDAGFPAGELDRLAEHGPGIDLLEIAFRQALGEPVPDELAVPADRQRPAAVRFLTADPGPLPVGRVRSVGTLAKALAFPGVAEVELDVEPGDRIGPLRSGDDRHGYVLAVAETNLEAHERAGAAARLVDVVVDP